MVNAHPICRIRPTDIPTGIKRRPAVKNRILYLEQKEVRTVDVVADNVVRARDEEYARSHMRIVTGRASALKMLVIVPHLEQGPPVLIHFVSTVP